jgi:large subunit ribosomal protein L21
MYAIVDIAGQQFKVEKDQKLFVHRLDAKEGSKVSFDKVLLVDDDGKVSIGSPVIDNTIVSAKVVSHLKGDKVIVFKKKRRKGYRKLNGHRQYLTELLIEGIGAGKVAAKKLVEKSETTKVSEKVAAKTEVAPKVSEVKKAEAPKKEAAPKKATAPKAAAKKTTPKAAVKKPVAKTTAKKTATKAAPKKDKKVE